MSQAEFRKHEIQAAARSAGPNDEIHRVVFIDYVADFHTEYTSLFLNIYWAYHGFVYLPITLSGDFCFFPNAHNHKKAILFLNAALQFQLINWNNLV